MEQQLVKNIGSSGLADYSHLGATDWDPMVHALAMGSGPSSKLRTRPVEDGDRAVVAEFLQVLVAELEGEVVAERLSASLSEEVAEALTDGDDDVMFVAQHGDRLVGCGRARILDYHPLLRFGASARHGYVEMMYVEPEARGHRVGEALLTALEDWLRGQGIERVTLHHSPRAREFYERLGYESARELMKTL